MAFLVYLLWHGLALHPEPTSWVLPLKLELLLDVVELRLQGFILFPVFLHLE